MIRFLLNTTLLVLCFAWGSNAWGQAASALASSGVIQDLNKYPKFSGDVDASFGDISLKAVPVGSKGPVSENSYFTAVQSSVALTGGRDFAYYFRFRVRGAQYGVGNRNGEQDVALTEGGRNDVLRNDVFQTGGVQTAQVRVRWRATDFLLVDIGRLPGIEGTGFADIQPGYAPVRSDGVNQLTPRDLGAIDLRFQLPIGLIVGMSVSSGCSLRCDRTARGRTFAVGSQQSILSYFSYVGRRWKIGYRDVFAFARGSRVGGVSAADDNDVETEASGNVGEFAVNFGGFYIGVESTQTKLSRVISIGANSASAALVAGSTSLDRDTIIPEKTDLAIALKFRFPNTEVYFQQVNEETNTGTSIKQEEVSFTNIGLLRKRNNVSYGFEYTIKSITPYSLAGLKEPLIEWSAARLVLAVSL